MKIKQIIKVTANVLLWVIFAISLFTVIASISSNKDVPNALGIGYLSVQSSSMEQEFYEGDLIFIHTTNADDLFEVDDIVTFHTIIEGESELNTHRIISYITVGNTRYYTTQGDNVGQSDTATITSGDIVAKYTGVKLSGFGNVADFIQSQTGFLICVVLPLAAVFIYEIVKFAMLMAKYKKEEGVDIKDMTEEQKAEIAKKYLASLEANKKDESPIK